MRHILSAVLSLLLAGGAAFAEDVEPPRIPVWPKRVKPIARLEGSSGLISVYSDGGTAILTAGGTQARAWDAKTLKPLTDPLKHETPLRSAAISADGRQVITVGGHVATLWEVNKREPVRVFKHADRVFDAQFSRDGKRIATACLDRHARVYDAATGDLLADLKQENPVRSVEFSLTGETLLCGTVLDGDHPYRHGTPVDANDPESPGEVFVWDIAKQKKLATCDSHYCEGRPVFSRDGKRVGFPTGRYGAVIAHADTGDVAAEWGFVAGMGDYFVRFSGDGNRFLVAGTDGSDVIDAGAYVLQVKPNPDYRRGGDAPTHWFDELMKYGPNESYRSIAISIDGRVVALATRSSTQVIDVEAKKWLFEVPFEDHMGWFGAEQGQKYVLQKSVNFSPDGKRLVVAHQEMDVAFHDKPTGKTFTTVWAVPPK
jgi:WD40 repeat protein